MLAKFIVYFNLLLIVCSCLKKESTISIDEAISLKDSIQAVYVPDKRVAIFDIDVKSENEFIVVKGETDQSHAIATFVNKLIKRGYKVKDQITFLPDSSVGKYNYAIVNNSVANLRSNPRHSAELATQAIMGTVLKVLKITEEWYLVQTPDDYIAWVDHGGAELKTKYQIEQWQKGEKAIVVKNYAEVYKNPNFTAIVSDVVLGNIFLLLDQNEEVTLVEFPDGRTGYLKNSDIKKFDIWLNNIKPSGFLVEYYARSLVGVPYLWGGTSAKGMDCSGFTKTVYFMNGLVIPRDASQQIEAGLEVDPDRKFEGLKKGDLLFFGKPATDSTKQKTTHVGIWLGFNEFIHASKQVRVSSIDPASPYYDEFNKNRYLGSRRYLRNINGNIKDLKSEIIEKK